MLLTGSNRRWTERAKVWQDGWRNLHHGPPRITGRFRPDGGRTTMTIERRWSSEAEIAGLHPHHRRQTARLGGERLEPRPGELATAALSQRAGTDPGGAPLRAVRRPGEDPRSRGDRSGRDPAPRDPARRRAPDPRRRRRRPRSSWRSSTAWTTSAPAASPRHSARNPGTSRRWNALSRPTRSRSRSGAP